MYIIDAEKDNKWISRKTYQESKINSIITELEGEGYSRISVKEEVGMVDGRTWKEFREIGLLWWINMLLHTFGWAICVELDDEGNITEVYPARVKFRGFSEKNNTDGYIKITKHLNETSEELVKETLE